MNNILLCADGSSYTKVSYEYAAWLAKHIEMNLEVLYVTDDRAEQTAQRDDLSGNIGIDSYQQLLQQLVEIEASKSKIERKKAKLILTEAKAFFAGRQIDGVKLTHETGFLVDLLHEFERNHDLIILGKRGENAGFAKEHLGSNMERIVRSSHKPCLVTPKEYKPVQKIILAYDGSKSCQKAIAYLHKSLPLQDLEFHLVTVDTGNTVKATQHSTSARQIIAEAGYTPITKVLQGDVEKAIQQYIDNNQIDLLIMGAYGHNRIRELIVGSTTTQMLRNSQIPILLFR